MKQLNQLTQQEKVTIALKIKDAAGFFVKYFEMLPKFNSQKECFHYLNEIHIEIYGTEKYSSFQSFRNVMYRDSKKYLNNK